MTLKVIEFEKKQDDDDKAREERLNDTMERFLDFYNGGELQNALLIFEDKEGRILVDATFTVEEAICHMEMAKLNILSRL